jgi:hypothetical protein
LQFKPLFVVSFRTELSHRGDALDLFGYNLTPSDVSLRLIPIYSSAWPLLLLETQWQEIGEKFRS